MLLELFNVTDNPHTIGKFIGEPLQVVTITPRKNYNTLYTSVTLSDTVPGVNYARLDGIFYFIDRLEVIKAGINVLYLKKDVLENYKEELQGAKIRVNAAKDTNKFISGYATNYDVRPEIDTLDFQGGDYDFTSDATSYIIACVGSEAE